MILLVRALTAASLELVEIELISAAVAGFEIPVSKPSYLFCKSVICLFILSFSLWSYVPPVAFSFRAIMSRIFLNSAYVLKAFSLASDAWSVAASPVAFSTER